MPPPPHGAHGRTVRQSRTRITEKGNHREKGYGRVAERDFEQMRTPRRVPAPDAPSVDEQICRKCQMHDKWSAPQFRTEKSQDELAESTPEPKGRNPPNPISVQNAQGQRWRHEKQVLLFHGRVCGGRYTSSKTCPFTGTSTRRMPMPSRFALWAAQNSGSPWTQNARRTVGPSALA